MRRVRVAPSCLEVKGTVTASRSPSVFGLSEVQLRPIVGVAVEGTIAHVEISVEHQVKGFYGFGAEKLIPTFNYVTFGGRRGQVTIFAKHSYEPDSAESEHYRFLGLHGAPLPQVYGTLRSPEGRPVLFLEYLGAGSAWHPIEYLDESGHTRTVLSCEERLEYLSLMARFNAIRPSPEYGAWFRQRRRGPEGAGEAGGLVEAVWEHACQGALGEELNRFCSENLRGGHACTWPRTASRPRPEPWRSDWCTGTSSSRTRAAGRTANASFWISRAFGLGRASTTSPDCSADRMTSGPGLPTHIRPAKLCLSITCGSTLDGRRASSPRPVHRGGACPLVPRMPPRHWLASQSGSRRIAGD